MLNEKLVKFLSDNKVIAGHAEGRRLILQGAIKINGHKIDDINYVISEKDICNGIMVVSCGKFREKAFRINKEEIQ